MYVSNLEEYGHLLNGDNFITEHVNNDMYMLFDNRLVSWSSVSVHHKHFASTCMMSKTTSIKILLLLSYNTSKCLYCDWLA